ncbi:MAG: glycoside hydrolase family 73 protein [Gammaproteobacteria bacterium]
MRHAELSTTALPATLPTAPTRPTAALDGGSGFGRAFSDIQGEVASFIAEGGGSARTLLTPEGGVIQARSTQALAQGGETTDAQQAFLKEIEPWAAQAAHKLGVAPELVSAHAALESSWGQRPIPGGSHNLFGIKAGAGWNGAVSETQTTEYVHGAAVKTSARFRAYPDAAGAFDDYARMLLANPRYQGALGAGSDAHAFAQGLARGGYATDPAYADKLVRVAARLQGTQGAKG